FHDRAVNAFDSGVGVADQGQQCVKSKRDDGESFAASTDPSDRQEESEERKAGHGLDDVSDAEHGFVEKGAAGDEDAERDSDECGKKDRNADDSQVFSGQVKDLQAILTHELPEGHKADIKTQRDAGKQDNRKGREGCAKDAKKITS